MSRLRANDWIRQITKSNKIVEAPTVTSALRIEESPATIYQNYLGYFAILGNYVESNANRIMLFSTTYKAGKGISIIKENFYNCMALFTARKSIKRNWINDKDEYIEPITRK